MGDPLKRGTFLPGVARKKKGQETGHEWGKPKKNTKRQEAYKAFAA